MPLYAAIDVGFPDDPKVIDAGDIAELVYLRCVLRCREHLTDGVIDRRVLPRWLAGIRGRHTTHLERLVEVGLLCTHPAGWCIPPNAWKKWNPTKAQVEEKRAEEKKRKAEYRERMRAEAMSQRDTHGTDAGVPPLSQDVKPEPSLKPEPSSSSTDDPTMSEALRRVEVLTHLGKTFHDKAAYTAAVYESLRAEGWTPTLEAKPCDDDDCDGGWLAGIHDDGLVPCPNCNPWLVNQ